jgi:hypothetical protein
LTTTLTNNILTYFILLFVYPGSVNVKTTIPLSKASVKVLFIGAEKLRPDVAAISGMLLEQRPFFAVRSVLYGKDQPAELDAGEHQFEFTIQLPMVNYPPSFEHPMCSCTFTLIAILESENQRRKYFERPVRYIPYIETSPLKNHYTLSSQQCMVALPSISYLPSDIIPITYSSGTNPLVSLTVKLRRRLTYGDEEIENSFDEVVCREETRFNVTTYSGTTYLSLPESTIPTIDYSNRMSMTYILDVTLKRTKLLGTAAHFTIPLTIGTMGPGIRTPADLKSYSKTKGGDTSTISAHHHSPCFVQRIEYEDCLPEYAGYKLPQYQTS